MLDTLSHPKTSQSLFE